ncbi:hypothetical protein KKG65_02365 [Patescibacteria group bacterium]|nr:hypothetical protein [Patescibacteria group bacterium]MBU1200032.1 hypothetical protein [Patescibacteria group bacterium]MBU1256624.1 hypothetical protein [Patescibacteria group bacterium]MBU1457421.1 hypothetical protein [Patescibacteria group bacterium]
MKMKKKQRRDVAQALIYGSVVAVTLSVIGMLGTDLYLASTQWLLVGILLAIWGIYLRMVK